MTVALFLEQILNGLQLGVMLLPDGGGLTLIFGVMGLINLAHGSLFMVGGFVCAAVAAWSGSFWIGIVASLAAAAALGAIVEIVVIRRLYDRDHLDQVLATFALVLMFSEGVRFLFGSFPLYLDPPAFLAGPVMLPGGLPYPAFRLAIIIAGLAVAAEGLGLLISRTRLGMQIPRRRIRPRDDRSTRRRYTLSSTPSVFALGAALAGFAGALVGAIQSVADRHGRAGADPRLRGDRHWRHRLDPWRACRSPCRRAGRHDGPFSLLPTLLSGVMEASAARGVGSGDCLHVDLSADGRRAGVQAERAVSPKMRDLITEQRLNIVLALILLGGPLIAHFADGTVPGDARHPGHHPGARRRRPQTSRSGSAAWSPSATPLSSVWAAMRWASSPAITRATSR